MKTKELIAALQKEDPSGELEVVAGGTPIYFVEHQPAYYDGNLEMLIQDHSLDPFYNIIGYKVTNRGDKIRLHLMDVVSCLADNEELPIDLSELSDYSRETWQEYLDEVRTDLIKSL